MNVKARHGTIYFITFINDFTQYDYVYLISHNSQALDCFIKFMNLVENQLNKKIKTLRIVEVENICLINSNDYMMKNE